MHQKEKLMESKREVFPGRYTDCRAPSVWLAALTALGLEAIGEQGRSQATVTILKLIRGFAALQMKKGRRRPRTLRVPVCGQGRHVTSQR